MLISIKYYEYMILVFDIFASKECFLNHWSKIMSISFKCKIITILSLTFFLSKSEAQLLITEVHVDIPIAGQFTIIGQEFDNGPNLEIFLGEFVNPLTIIADSPNLIVAELPNLLPSDYLLQVRTSGGGSGRRSDSYALTIGQPMQPEGFPSGGVIIWDQTNFCPSDFSRAPEYDGRFLMGSDEPGIWGGVAFPHSYIHNSSHSSPC